MPIYEYRCVECQQLFEEWCKRVEDRGTENSCPICKGLARRIMSNTSFALKGDGWYVTEYGSRRTEGKSGMSCSGSVAPASSAACATACASAGACGAAASTPA